jgi:selT/selW/selH-like putative selenoprotein
MHVAPSCNVLLLPPPPPVQNYHTNPLPVTLPLTLRSQLNHVLLPLLSLCVLRCDPRRFIALADAIEAAFPNVVVEGNPEGPGRPGAFEVKAAAGQLLFSRLGSGGWPQHQAVVEALAAAAACSTGGEAAQQA